MSAPKEGEPTSDRRTERKTKRLFSLEIQTDGLTERQIQDRKTFQLSYQNKSCSECQQDFRKIETWKDRPTDRQTD